MKPEDILNKFKSWAADKFKFTFDELVGAFAYINSLTPEETLFLIEQLKKENWSPPEPPKPPEPPEPPEPEPPDPKFPPPKPPRPRGEVFKLFLDYWRKNPSLQSGQAVSMFTYYAKLSSLELLLLKEDLAAYLYEEKLKEEKEKERKRIEEEKKIEEKKKKEEEEKKKEEERRKKEEEEKKKEKPKVPKGLTIPRIPYPKWWNDSLNSKISLTAPGSQVLASVSGRLRLFVSMIVITVTDETIITINFGNAGSSGPIYLGGTNQPMGMVVAMGNSPAPCGNGSLVISATDPGAANPSVGGWATCFAMPEKG